MKTPGNGGSVLLNVKCESKNDGDKDKKNRNQSRSNYNEKNSGSSNNRKRSFYELSLSLILLLWCFVFLFYSELGLSHENGGNSSPHNRSIICPGISDGRHSEDACSYVANGGKNFTDGMLLELNKSCGDKSTFPQNITRKNYSLRESDRLGDVVWRVLGNTSSVCQVQEQVERNTSKRQLLDAKTPNSTYLKFDEFRNITKQEKGLDMPSQLNITHRLELDGTEYNYASAMKGAKVVAHNKEAKGASNILGKDHDRYLRNPCSVGGKFVVIELAEEILVDAIKIANFEHYSSNLKEFELSGSLNYPTEIWSPLGKFVAANVKHNQAFKLPEPKWVRYLKINLLSHYGSEFYCTLSVIEVYGVDAIERMLEDLFVASEEPVPVRVLRPDPTTVPLLKLEVNNTDGKKNGEAQAGGLTAASGVENTEDAQRLSEDVAKDPVPMGKIPDPVFEVRQHSVGRIPGDTVLKILMQKVKSLELNLSVLEEYIKEMNRRQSDVLPDLDKELTRILLLLESSIAETRDLKAWKEIMDKDLSDLQSWKAVVSSHMDLLVGENHMLRLDVEKISKDQANLESKELSVLAVSLFFMFLAILRLISIRVSTILGTSQTEKVGRTSRGWVLILLSSSMTIFITLLSS